MSDRPRLGVKPIKVHGAVTLREMLGMAGQCLWFSCPADTKQNPLTGEKKAIRQLHHLVL